MSLAVTREGEGSWSRRRIPSPELRRGSKRNRGGASSATAVFGMTTRSRGPLPQQQSPRSKSATTKLDGTGERLQSEGRRKRKSAKLDGVSRRVSSSKKGKRSQDRSEKKAKKRNRAEEEDDGSCSSAVSSPLREPYLPVEVERYPDGTVRSKRIDGEISSKYKDMQEYYYEKIARQMKMSTLIPYTPPNCLVNDPTLLHIREPARKMVLCAAQFVVGLSSSIDGEPLARCSGFWIDFDSEKRIGTVATTAHLICTKSPSLDAWLCKDEYASDPQVTVHLRGGTVAKGCLTYHQKHYNLAFFRVKTDQSIQLPSFSDKVECAQDIFELGRNESVKLVINHGKVEYLNPTVYERYHHMYIQGPHRDREYDKGGPVVDLAGKVAGMIDSCPEGSFIPSSVLLKCFHLWKNFGHIRRPQLGLKFYAISFLNPVQVEDILIKHKINEGLIVKEVSEGSPAEKCGIRVGDVVECFNGKRISTAVELENMLLSIVVDSGDGLNSNLDVEIQVYCTRRYLRRIKVLTVKVSEDGEFVVRASRLVTSPSASSSEPRSDELC